jgi:3-hexulose-6-phosphate synthase/6-phospho-3-hexuloisomerase
MDAVRELKKALPGRRIVADMKTVDTGAMEVEMAAKAGAEIVAMLASADDATIEDALRAARKYGVQIMMDLLTVPDPVQRSKEVERLGVDYICVHVGIDQQMRGMDTIDFLKEIVKEVKTPVAAAGGIDPISGAEAVASGAAIVIVGGNITRSADVTLSALKLREAIDHASRIQPKRKSLEEETIAIFREVSTPNISDAMHRKGAMCDVSPINRGIKMVGVAITVQAFPGDWAKPVEAIDLAQPGDALVIDCGGVGPAIWGELATHSAIQKGLAGVVIDGAIRDTGDIINLRFPAFSRLVTPNAGEPKGFGEIGVPVKIGGQRVETGDWLLGDDDGVTVLPQKLAVEYANRAMDVLERENRIRAEIKEGRTLAEVTDLLRWEKKV